MHRRHISVRQLNPLADSLGGSRTATPKARISRSPALIVPGTTTLIRSNSIHQHRGATLPLSSSHSRLFGSNEPFLRLASTASRKTSQPSTSKTVAAAAVYTPEQMELVKNSWQLLKKDAGNNGMKMFLKVFEIAPSAQQLFSFLRDSPIPLEQNSQLKPHAVTVFKLVGDAATQLAEKGGIEALRGKLLELGASHNMYGVVDEHFDVVKYALLQTIQEELPEMWSPELKGAWGQAYDEVVGVIKDEMKALKTSAK